VIFQLFDISSAAKRYDEVFREAGLDPSTLDVSQAAALIRSSAIRESQIAAIDNWARAIPRPVSPLETAATEPATAETNSPEVGDKSTLTDESTLTGVNTNDADTVALRQKLLAIANAADDSEWRRTVRAALEANDTTKLKELAATDEARSQSPELIAWLGAALRDGEEAEASVAVLLQAQRQNPGDFWLNYELGKSFSKQGDHLEGLGFARASLGIRPQSLGALMALAASSSSAKRYEDAAAIYRSVVTQNPRLVEAHTELASVATSLEQWDEAIAAYRTVLELDPNNVEVRASMGIAHRSAQHYQEAVDTCRKAVELDPRNVYAHLCLGQVLCGVRIGGVSQNKAAEKEFRIAIELDPTNARAYYYLGHLKLYGSNQRDAAADLRTAVKLDPNLGAAYAYLSHFSNDAVGKKIAYARKAVEFDPSDSYAHTALSIALRGSGHLDESLSAARAAVACDPNDAFAHCMLGEGGFVRRWYQRASCGGM
jgi:tetratricopeptide (TPR) repeat protein